MVLYRSGCICFWLSKQIQYSLSAYRTLARPFTFQSKKNFSREKALFRFDFRITIDSSEFSMAVQQSISDRASYERTGRNTIG
ncbi:hypothetical protein D3C86_1644710 [compost metagenome]